jgi:hypothetical protein
LLNIKKNPVHTDKTTLKYDTVLMHQVCMDNIKALACKVPILCPIDPSGDEPIWLICDASASEIGAVYKDLIGNPADPQDLCLVN